MAAIACLIHVHLLCTFFVAKQLFYRKICCSKNKKHQISLIFFSVAAKKIYMLQISIVEMCTCPHMQYNYLQHNSFNQLKYRFHVLITGLSMNILRTGNKLPVQRGFIKNNALRFLGELYNFCNFVIIFSLM